MTAEEEVQDAIVDADVKVANIHDFPYIAICVTPRKDNVRPGWIWSKISSIEVKMPPRGGTLFRVIREGEKTCRGGYEPVARSTFNKLAREMLAEAIVKYHGIDPTNPDEADFMPVSNYRSR